MLKQATLLAQGCSVCGVRQRVLNAVYCSKSPVTRQKELFRSGNEDNPEPKDRGTRLSLLCDGHRKADCARDYLCVTRTGARRCDPWGLRGHR
eukprot:2031867-Pleurochrysis_carterae.AAC.1